MQCQCQSVLFIVIFKQIELIFLLDLLDLEQFFKLCQSMEKLCRRSKHSEIFEKVSMASQSDLPFRAKQKLNVKKHVPLSSHLFLTISVFKSSKIMFIKLEKVFFKVKNSLIIQSIKLTFGCRFIRAVTK